MLLSVAICTWNRADLLRATLDRMTGLEVPRGHSWELIVVNNASTDHTDAVIAEFTDRLPIRRVLERKQGHSNARNAAVAAASGDYIIWTDDDVLVEPDWLRAYVDAFTRHPEAVIFGGPVLPWFDGEPPAWLSAAMPHVENAYALVDHGGDEFALDNDRYPFGANMAFRLAEHRRLPFDPALGRKGTGMLGGDELVHMRTLFAQGHTGWWVPGARVHHFVPRDRQTMRYLRRYYYATGQLIALVGERGAYRAFLGRPLWLWKQALTYEARFQLRRPFASSAAWMPEYKTARISWGQLVHYPRRLETETARGA